MSLEMYYSTIHKLSCLQNHMCPIYFKVTHYTVTYRFKQHLRFTL